MATQPQNELETSFSELNVNDEDHELIEKLIQLSKKSPKLSSASLRIS